MSTRLATRRILVCAFYFSAIGLLLGVPWSSAFAQKRVIQKWVNRVEGPTGGTGPTIPVIAADSEGNAIVAGNADITNNTTGDSLPVIKYSPAGKELWSITVTTPGYAPVAQAATVDSSGNFFVTAMGFSINVGPMNEFVTAKISASGTVLWSETYPFRDMNSGPPPFYGGIAGIVVDSAGNSYISGWDLEDTTGVTTTIKYSPAGTQLWATQFAGVGTSAGVAIVYGIALDGENNVLIAGQVQQGQITFPPNGFNSFGVTVKYNTNGVQQWAATEGMNSTPSGAVYQNNAITVDPSGNAYVAGWFNTNGATCPDTPAALSAGNNSEHLCPTGYVVKYTSSGAEAWMEQGATWGSTAIKLDREENIFTGGSYFTSNSSHYSVTKLNSSGVLQWNRTYQHTTTGNDQGLAMAVNYDSDVYITGQSTSTNDATGLDCVTLKFDYKGDLDWVAVYNGPGNGNDIGMGIAYSGSYLYIAAESVGANKAPGFATIEYVQDAAVVSPTPVTFPAQKIGTTSAAQTVTLTNTYWGDDLTLMGIDVHGPFEATNNCSKNIVPFGTCTLTIKFVPTAVGTATGSIDIYDQWAGSPAVIQLSGSGTN
jgi:hypothetical protein